MRVLLLGPFPPPHGGVQTHLVALRQFLRRRDVPCSVVNITGNRKVETDDVYYPKSAVGLLALLLRLKYDVIHLHFGGNLSLRLLGLTLACCLMPKSRTILTFHSGGYPQSAAGRGAGYWTIRGFVLRRLDAAIGVNAELATMFRRFGVEPARAHQIAPHTVTSTEGPQLTRSEHNDSPVGALMDFCASHSPLLLTVGGLEPEYDIPRQIAAIGILRKVLPDIGLAVVGGGSLEKQIQSLIECQPQGVAILQCGDLPHDATRWAISVCDLLLRTTIYDGDSIAVREALQMGTPVVATDNGMRPEGVRLVAGPGADTLAAAIVASLGLERNAIGSVAEADETNLEAVWRVYRCVERAGDGRVSRGAVVAD